MEKQKLIIETSLLEVLDDLEEQCNVDGYKEGWLAVFDKISYYQKLIKNGKLKLKTKKQ